MCAHCLALWRQEMQVFTNANKGLLIQFFLAVNRPIHAEFEAWSLCLDVQRDLHLQLFSLQRILPAGQNQLQRYLSGNYGIKTKQLPILQIQGSCQEYSRHLSQAMLVYRVSNSFGNWLETQESVIWQGSCKVQRFKVAVKWRYLRYLSNRETGSSV
jgi:hypothetical protein